MALDDSVLGKALISLFPTKRYAPHKSVDSGCPIPPPGWDTEEKEGDNK